MFRKNYNCLSDSYNELFIRNIKEFKVKAKKDKKYSVFYPSFGSPKNENPEFLIYGQAVKGWEPVFNVSEKFQQQAILKNSIIYSNDYYIEKDHSPLDWVNVYWSKSYFKKTVTTKSEKEFYPPISYSTFRSFFWNITYKLICRYYELNEDSWEWTKKMIWSNLYKIAPFENKNPSNEECLWQQKHSIELVKKEIEEINPKFCIVITNDSWWQPFRESLNTKLLSFSKQADSVIQSFEKYKNTKIIITTRPFNRDRNKHVIQLLELIK